jgi:CO/xanthine dehydrogenase FAD-binding subunit
MGAAGAAPKVIDRTASEADVEAIAQRAYELAEGVDSLPMPGAYRRKMVRVLTKRAIKAALDGFREGM